MIFSELSKPNVQQLPAADALLVLNDVVEKCADIDKFALMTGVRAVAYHFGWTPAELLAIWEMSKQYVPPASTGTQR